MRRRRFFTLTGGVLLAALLKPFRAVPPVAPTIPAGTWVTVEMGLDGQMRVIGRAPMVARRLPDIAGRT